MRLTVLMAFLLPLAACATSEPTPQRSALTVPAEVASIDRSLLIGRWSCTEMNPLPDAPAFTQTMRFGTDGRAVQDAVASTGEETGTEPMRLNLHSTYDWSIEGGRLIATNVETDVTAGNDEAMSSWMAGLTQMIADSFGDTNEPGAYSVRELSSSRLVMQAADVDDPAVLGCTRVS
ncbi:hypothetical protein [Marinivivus vitaminiproducens]|uniref:hypothetical protein n=1 Tax=Marinivivus vitaminiproducens TaxID=3035935 RepID=UPI00279B7D64|nr:hypothetical protein P4R82_09550 [Geminicoccaceae bacterium SCSIO 64248]